MLRASVFGVKRGFMYTRAREGVNGEGGVGFEFCDWDDDD